MEKHANSKIWFVSGIFFGEIRFFGSDAIFGSICTRNPTPPFGPSHFHSIPPPYLYTRDGIARVDKWASKWRKLNGKGKLVSGEENRHIFAEYFNFLDG